MKLTILTALFILIGFASYGQSVSGAPNVTLGEQKTYTYTGVYYTSYSWSTNNGYGSVGAMSYNSTTGVYTVVVTWSISAGTSRLTFYNNASVGIAAIDVTIACGAAPATPATPVNSSSACGPQTLSFNGTPESGATWYWQDTNSAGTSTANSSSNYSATVSGTYYLRSKLRGCWSAASSIVVTVSDIPITPAAILSVTAGCGPKTVTITGTKPSQTRWHWQGTNPNGTTINDASSATISLPGTYTYYLRASNSSGICWSTTSQAITIEMTPVPDVPANPTTTSLSCGIQTLSFTASPTSGTTWYWQDNSATGTSTANSSSSYSAYITGPHTYYLRAFNSGNSGCWSAGAGSVSATSVVAPQPPTVTLIATTNLCGNKTVTASGTVGQANEKWYWQGNNANGTSTAVDVAVTSTQTISTSDTYHVRAYNYSTGCWSVGTKSIVVNVTQPPATPATPTTTSLACGFQTLSFTGAPPGGTTWYWQGTVANGQSNSISSASTYTTTQYGSANYYLNAYSNGCWSNSLAVVNSTATAYPQAPPAASMSASTNFCGPKTVTISTASKPVNDLWNWEGINSGGRVINTNATQTVTTSDTYYLVASNAGGTCWSAPVGITVTINDPPTPNAPITDNAACGVQVLSKSGTLPANTNWYWQVASGDTDNTTPSATAATKTAGANGNYYLRARNSGGCWSQNSSLINVTLTYNNPATPNVPVITTNTCGIKTVTKPTAPGGITYYWEPDVSGVDVTSASALAPSFQTESNGTYVIRAKDNNGNCWSTLSFPVTVDPADVTLSSYSITNPISQATHSIRLLPGFATAGNTFNAKITLTAECNDMMNWQEQIVYDQNAQPVSRGRSYFDGFGNPLQSQSMDYLNNKVWVSQPLYDRLNNSVASTLPAPIVENEFLYKSTFVQNAAGQRYTTNEYDKGISTAAGEVFNPNPVGNAAGTLGWYYSTNNTLEPKAPVTQYPYGRSYTPEGPDPTTTTSAGAGNAFKMGSGHESKSERFMIGATDLTHYNSLRTYFPTSTTTQNLGYKYISTDANGKRVASFVDGDGKTIVSAVVTSGSGGSYAYDYWSYTYYNDAGQVIGTVAPKDVIIGNSGQPVSTSYKYDQLGRLIETTSPDEGTSRFVYSTDGKIRFSENQEQRNASPKKFSYTNYDQLGRLIESGEYSSTAGGYVFEPHSTATPASLSVLNVIDNVLIVPIESVSSANYVGVSQKLDGARCGDYSFITYDGAGSGSPATQSFLYGNVSKTQNVNATTWYSYDEDGLLVWMKQSIIGLGTKTIDYTYDYFGNVTQVAYQAGQPDAFYHHYTYDINQRLTEVRTSKDGVSKTLQAKYYYYLHGPLKRVELANNLQGLDYVYTIDGSLKSINHADVAKDPGGDGSNGFSPDVFGMTLDYFNNDYQGAGYSTGTISNNGTTDYYNGLIKSASWFTPVDNSSVMKVFGYTYDNLNQFQNARFGSLTGTAGSYTAALSATNYNETVSSYDKNGNIQSLSRRGKNGSLIDDFAYTYTPSTNKLASISGSASIGYKYNRIGQLTKQTKGTRIDSVQYNAYGLVKAVLDENNAYRTQYFYDDRGDLVKRITYNAGTVAKTTYYVHDAAGNVLATYEQPNPGTLALVEVPVYGAGRIAVYKPVSNTTFYEINDHLGNVRAVIGAPSTEIFTATMETETMATEDAKFKNIAPRWVSTAANNTPGGNEAIRINNGSPNGGYPGRAVGPGIVLHVAPGDVISAEVYGYYEGGTGYSSTLPIATIAANVATAFGGISGAAGDPGKLFSSLNAALNAPNFGGLAGSGNDNVPAAFLNMVMLDENMMPDVTNLPNAAVPIPATANMTKQKMSFGPITIPSPGYVYIYIDDNSNSNNWIYFDDLKVTQLHSPFVAGGDYYPFGLTMDDRQIKLEDYRYGYQGQYSEENSQTGWNEFELRMYDPRIGRWISPDPYSVGFSPYIGMGNQPISLTDPDGGAPCCGWTFNTELGAYVFDTAIEVVGSRFVPTVASLLTPIATNVFKPEAYGDGSMTYMSKANQWVNFNSITGALQSYNNNGDWEDQGNVYDMQNGQARSMMDFSTHVSKEVSESVVEYMAAGMVLDGAFVTLKYGARVAGRVFSNGRVFWSGGEEVMNAATKYAMDKGLTTLGMTRAGKNLQALITSRNIPWSEARPMWARLSKMYAKGARGSVDFFGSEYAGSIWMEFEKPILTARGIGIVPH